MEKGPEMWKEIKRKKEATPSSEEEDCPTHPNQVKDTGFGRVQYPTKQESAASPTLSFGLIQWHTGKESPVYSEFVQDFQDLKIENSSRQQ